MKQDIDSFFNDPGKWQVEFTSLRRILLDCGLDERFKWGKPCYVFQERNVVLIHGFKNYCALLFHKGALLKDAENLLVQQTKNVQAARQIRFTNAEDIENHKAAVKAYVYEAMEVEKAGLEVMLKTTSDFDMPDEFKQILKRNPDVKDAFDKLTPGRQRGYLLYFSGAKQSDTRIRRIEKYTQNILNGKGLNDR
ncbi:hypothetical protein LCGC14_1453710 [marine sediment metagenome]|uniref:YdhG-like domain-containing protein n=2 Tax=root TaxID=1 RepID=A0A831VPG7_9FLAO|nr:hypothetical protein [Pricia antarctica]